MKETNQNKKSLRQIFQEFITKVTFNQMPAFMADYLLSHLSGNEFKVMYAIARQTYGWFKFSDKIAGSKLASLTNIPKSNIHRYTKSLETKGYLTVNRNKSNTKFNDSNEYTINAEYILSLQNELKVADKPAVDTNTDVASPIRQEAEVASEVSDVQEESAPKQVEVQVETPKPNKEEEHASRRQSVTVTVTYKERVIKVLAENKYEIRGDHIYRLAFNDRKGHYCDIGSLIEVKSLLKKAGLSLDVIQGIKPYKAAAKKKK